MGRGEEGGSGEEGGGEAVGVGESSGALITEMRSVPENRADVRAALSDFLDLQSVMQCY